MSKPKLGKNHEDIFAPTITETKEEHKSSNEKAARGRPQVHSEQWTKVTTVLFNKQIAWLDHLAADIRMNTGAALSRAELIRAMLASVESSDLDFSDITSEKDLTEKLIKRLRNK